MTFLEQASVALHQAGKRMTDQRRLVINTLEKATDHLDADAVFQLVRSQDSSISIATVYRTLNVLEEAGLVQQRYLSPDHDRKHFELVAQDEHYHFTCKGCGAQIPFTSTHLDQLQRELESTLGVSVSHLCCCADGLCGSCRTKDWQPSDQAS